MDSFFVEDIISDTYRLALFDRNNIFSATNPGNLANVFECSLQSPTRSDNAQIFYGLGDVIDATDFFVDLKNNYRFQHLNTWSISVKDGNNPNIFSSVKPIDRCDRMELYSVQHSITPKETIVSKSESLFSLVEFSKVQSWKTGILQRCIDNLVLPQYRKDPLVYCIIDEEYRRLMRFKLETECNDDIADRHIILFIRKITSLLQLQNTHDTTSFTNIPDEVEKVLNILSKMIPRISKSGTLLQRLDNLFYMWSGAHIKVTDDKYHIEVDPNVVQGLKYLQPWLSKPSSIVVMEPLV